MIWIGSSNSSVVEHWPEKLCVAVRFCLRGRGRMAERLKAAILKVDGLTSRRFKSYCALSSSLMVKRATHNRSTVGSSPTWKRKG